MNSRANCSSMWLGTTYIGFLISPACFIFMPVAAIVKVLPAPTAWASSVLPLLMPRQTASFWCGSQRDRLVHAGEVEVRAVEQPGPQVVVGVVVEPHQPLGAVGVGEDPGLGTAP